jgi:hypothetical protein
MHLQKWDVAVKWRLVTHVEFALLGAIRKFQNSQDEIFKEPAIITLPRASFSRPVCPFYTATPIAANSFTQHAAS